METTRHIRAVVASAPPSRNRGGSVWWCVVGDALELRADPIDRPRNAFEFFFDAHRASLEFGNIATHRNQTPLPVTGGGRYWVGGGRYWVGGGRYPVFLSTSVLLTLLAMSSVGVKKVVTRRTLSRCFFLAARAFAVR